MKIDKRQLAIAMAIKGLNFMELAELSNVSRQTISYLNNGKECSPETAARISKALAVPLSSLLEVEETKKSKVRINELVGENI